VTRAGANGRGWPGLRVSLFGQVLTLVLVSLIAAQAINLAILFSLPPPPPVIFRPADVAEALHGQTVTSRDGVPLSVHVQAGAPPTYYFSRYTLSVAAEVAKRIGVAPERVIFSSEPVRYKLGRTLTPPKVALNIRDEHLLLAPFAVGVRRPDGRWTVVAPREPFPNIWQQRIVLWFVISAAALAPLAYLFARRLSAPIGAFAAAAERLGRDPRAPPLHLQGPPEVQQAASAFNEMQERLRRYVDDRTAMVGAVAHDLRTPLTRLRFRVEGAPDSLRDKMVADVDQMDAMISSALAFVRDATQPFERRRLELSSLVESVAVEMAETGLDVSAESISPVVIEGDPVALRRLVANLLDNAVKFGASARARVYREDGAAVVEVDDNGPGIPDTERDRVFEPFHRGEPSRSRETGGAGLGLAVVRSVARAHGGEASLSNRAEGGLRACVRLPV
jgi:two-component system, OmpR family, sensor kinase